MVDDRTTFLNY